MNLVLQKQLVKKDSELEERDRQLQTKMEELQDKDKELKSLQQKLDGRSTNLLGYISMFVVGMVVSMMVRVMGLE